jgi:hypothetical protein
MLRRVALVITDVSEEYSASFIRVTRIGEIGRTLAITSNRRTLPRLLVTASVLPISPILVTLMKEAFISSETSVFTRATLRNIPENSILQEHFMLGRFFFLHNNILGAPVVWNQCQSQSILFQYKENSVALCPQGNYTDRMDATCWGR